MATGLVDLYARQIWVDPTPVSSALPHTCTPFKLSSGGQLNVGHGTIITLTQDVAFQPSCAETPVPPPIDLVYSDLELPIHNGREPWYASTIPQIYAISAVTIVSYMLVIILFITPRTFFVGGAGGGGGFLGRSGVINSAYGNNAVIGIGSRPWLQKLAALTVAISMTIVTADTFTWAHRQYDAGYQDTQELTIKVISGLEIRIVRVISETFLWLAQSQTLIRLFPRHKEKLLIKWMAFALIVLELIFSCLNHFLSKSSHSQKFVSAIPALNYLFALTLNLCYGGFIIYYALQKRRFAFYHPHMRNMPLVALLSLAAILIPVVFFVIDLSSPNISGWGAYVRWVGSAAASVVVWEWVERIEALERDEKKGGILGREIFDGDEMLDANAGSNASWPSSQTMIDKEGRRSSDSGFGLSTGWSNMTAKARQLGRFRQGHTPTSQPGLGFNVSQHHEQEDSHDTRSDDTINQVSPPTLPAAVVSPPSRAATSSPGSTVYVVRYHDVNGAPSTARDDTEQPRRPPLPIDQRMGTWVQESQEHEGDTPITLSTRRRAFMDSLQRMPNPFRRPRETPPPEVARALADHMENPGMIQNRPSEHISMLERLRMKKAAKVDGPPRAVIVVPAPPRRRVAWNDEVNSDRESDHATAISAEGDQFATEDEDSSRNAAMPPDAVINAVSTPEVVSPRQDE